MRSSILFILSTALIFTCSGLYAFQEQDSYGTKGDVSAAGAGVLIRDNTLFMTTGSGTFSKVKSLTAIDISKPEEPQMLSRLQLKGFPQDIASDGNMIFAVDGLRLYIIDAADPKSLKLISETAISDNPLYGPQGVAVKKGTAYLACRRNGVRIYDISNTAEPKLKKSIETPFSRGIAIGDDGLVFSADDTRGVSVIQDGKVVSTVPVESGSAARVRVSDSTLYVANGTGILKIFSICQNGTLTPRPGIEKLTHHTYYGTYCYDLATSGNSIFLACGENGVLAIDVSNPEKPAVSAYSAELLYSAVKGVAARDKFVFASDNSENLVVINIAESGRMKIASRFNLVQANPY